MSRESPIFKKLFIKSSLRYEITIQVLFLAEKKSLANKHFPLPHLINAHIIPYSWSPLLFYFVSLPPSLCGMLLLNPISLESCTQNPSLLKHPKVGSKRGQLTTLHVASSFCSPALFLRFPFKKIKKRRSSLWGSLGHGVGGVLGQN